MIYLKNRWGQYFFMIDYLACMEELNGVVNHISDKGIWKKQ